MTTKNTKKQLKPVNEYEIQFNKIGSRIKQLRIKAGYSAADKFAYDHDIHPAQYARYERGADMRICSLLKIVTVHEITLQEFFKGIN